MSTVSVGMDDNKLLAVVGMEEDVKLLVVEVCNTEVRVVEVSLGVTAIVVNHAIITILLYYTCTARYLWKLL